MLLFPSSSLSSFCLVFCMFQRQVPIEKYLLCMHINTENRARQRHTVLRSNVVGSCEEKNQAEGLSGGTK